MRDAIAGRAHSAIVPVDKRRHNVKWCGRLSPLWYPMTTHEALTAVAFAGVVLAVAGCGGSIGSAVAAGPSAAWVAGTFSVARPYAARCAAPPPFRSTASGLSAPAERALPTLDLPRAYLVTGCSVADDYAHALGDPLERRLAAALAYCHAEQCPAATGLAAPGTAAATLEPPMESSTNPRGCRTGSSGGDQCG